MKNYKYMNEYVYYVVTPTKVGGLDALHVCAGVNNDRFFPLVTGPLGIGIGGNKIISGLRLVNVDICTFAVSRGASPRITEGNSCGHIAPTTELWFSEPILIENSSNISPDEIIKFGVEGFVQKVINSWWSDYKAPDHFLTPAELQTYFDELIKNLHPVASVR